ncbi:hypothetical protein AX16_010320, partial [Volvariella volvacea WC 439]
DSAAQSPVAALAYAAQFRYQALFDHAAPLVMQSNTPLHEVLLSLPQALWTKWFHYNKRWNTAFRTAINTLPVPTQAESAVYTSGCCYYCGKSLSSSQQYRTSSMVLLQFDIVKKLASTGNFTDLKAINHYLEKFGQKSCKTCSRSLFPYELLSWKGDLHRAIQKILPPTLTQEMQEPQTAVAVSSTSRLFSFSDADIKIRSEDGIEFQLHKNHLEVCCGAFPPSSYPTMNEVVHLTESGSTLEMLFQFIYSREQPDWEGLEFSKLQDLAEAAEKYQVHVAICLCKILMKRFIRSHPAGVFAYATKHGHNDIADVTALLLLKSGGGAKDLMSLLTPNAILALARYLEHIWGLCNKAITSFPGNIPLVTESRCCDVCRSARGSNKLQGVFSSFLKELVSSPEEGIFKLDKLSLQSDNHGNNLSFEFRKAFREWREETNKDIQSIPVFREFL